MQRTHWADSDGALVEKLSAVQDWSQRKEAYAVIFSPLFCSLPLLFQVGAYLPSGELQLSLCLVKCDLQGGVQDQITQGIRISDHW